MLFRRDLSVEVSGVVDHLKLVEDVSAWKHIHCDDEDPSKTHKNKVDPTASGRLVGDDDDDN